MSDLITITVKDHVADVRLNRPDEYNALSPEMFKSITDAGKTVSADAAIRAVVLSGEGRGFCAGLDFESFAAMQSTQGDLDIFSRSEESPANNAQLAGYIWKQAPMPVIAAIHGVAFGGGLQIALGADMRLATPDARFSVMEIKWGIIPDMSLTQTLRDLVRLDVAKELTFTGKIVSSEEAVRLGLITRMCDDPRGEALELARKIATKSPQAVAAGKRLLDKAWHGDTKEGLLLEESLQRTLIGTPNQIEAVMANFEKRTPHFIDRE